MITQRALLTPMYHNECLCIPVRVLGRLYKEIFPPNAEILSLAETWILLFPVGRIYFFLKYKLTCETTRRQGKLYLSSAIPSLQYTNSLEWVITYLSLGRIMTLKNNLVWDLTDKHRYLSFRLEAIRRHLSSKKPSLPRFLKVKRCKHLPRFACQNK